MDIIRSLAFASTLPPRRDSPPVAPVFSLGVDLTAGDETAGYAIGEKPTACVLLREDVDGLHLDHVARFHANAEIVTFAEEVAARGRVVVVIDGPCMDAPPGVTGHPCARFNV